MKIIGDKHTVEKVFLSDDGVFPNNALPVLYYPNVLSVPKLLAGVAVKSLFKENGWLNSWSGGILTVHHYHSNTFEVLGVISGATRLLLGGDNGQYVSINEGDVLIIPPGVAHKNMGKEGDATCIGAYPDGINYNMRYGKAGERPQSDHEIQAVTCPAKDPVFGQSFMEILNPKV